MGTGDRVIIDKQIQHQMSGFDEKERRGNNRVASTIQEYLDANKKRASNGKDKSDQELASAGWRKDRLARKSNTTLTELDYMICSEKLVGFVLSAKTWADNLLVDGISDIEWKEDPYQFLQLQSHHKVLVKTLVEGFSEGTTVLQDDIIKGKGNGLIFLLHGPPGLGKTLTAGTIALHSSHLI
jgi:flagellar biosynthesis GTPase FlhF